MHSPIINRMRSLDYLRQLALEVEYNNLARRYQNIRHLNHSLGLIQDRDPHD